MTWSPLFPKSEREWLYQSVHGYTHVLLSQLNSTSWSLSLEQGLGALTLYFKTLQSVLPHPHWETLSAQLLSEISRREPYKNISLYGGGMGTHFLLNLCGQESGLTSAQAKLSKDRIAKEINCDLVNGLTGTGVALLQSQADPRLTQAVVQRLMKLLKQPNSQNAYWPMTHRKRRKVRVSKKLRAPLIDLGLAHGIPGILLYLAYLNRIEPGLISGRHKKQILNAAQFLLSYDRGEALNGFGYFSDDPKNKLGRSAWCYGDPGVGFALLQLGLSFKKKQLVSEGKRIALRGLARAPERSMIQTPFFCHGAIGLAHISARIFALTSDQEFKKQAIRWYQISAELFRQGPFDEGSTPNLFVHSLGYYLFALAACDKKDPAWDAMMLLSQPGGTL